MMHNHQQRRRGFQRIVNRITGMTYAQLAVLYLVLLIIFTVTYFILAIFAPAHGPTLPQGHPLMELLEAFYFSTMTATTVGYGDILPQGFSKLLVGLQAVSSLFIFAVLVSKPISERQEAALYQMHQLTFDEIFNATREGFFIVRKDLDRLTEESRSGALTPASLEDLTTAYRQAQVFMDEIPKFYDTERKLYIIDGLREELLLESVERTFDRLVTLLHALSEKQIPWKEHQESMGQLRELHSLTGKTLTLWRNNSPHAHRRNFGKLEGLIREISTKVKG